MYGVGSGHFISTITKNNLPFNIVLAVDVSVHGWPFIHLFAKCPRVVSGLEDMIVSIVSDVGFSVVGYSIYSPRDMPPQQHDFFWIYQLQIIRDCHQRFGLHSLIIHVNDICPNGPMRTFNQELLTDGWLLSNFQVYYPDFGNSIDSTAAIVLGIHSSTGATEEPTLILPPQIHH